MKTSAALPVATIFLSLCCCLTSFGQTAPSFLVSAKQRGWWAFQPIRADPPPVVVGVASPIDRFVRAELAKRGMKPAARADKRTLIRRVTFDLTGLPPAPEEIAAFLADNSPNAFAKVVDRLLASPAYGEKFARHWLDVVRYADYHDGDPKARTASCEPLEAWRYRDWVVRAFNADMPFDKFITHQIAGDLLSDPGHGEFYADGLIATTFLSNGCWDRGDADKEKMVSDMVDDQIDTVGKAFMGLTLGCARCHNHKFDPISTADYYALAGIFYSTHILKDIGTKGGEYTLNRIPLAPDSYVTKRDSQLKQLADTDARLAELDKAKAAADDPPRLELIRQKQTIQKELLPEPALVEAAQEGGSAGGLFPGMQDVPVHFRGSYTRLGPVVPRAMPAFFVGGAQPAIEKGSGRRELAAWIASKDNPLTARVIVNRVWQWHFGTGLVKTPNNFGVASEPPSHPRLLDWLAETFASPHESQAGTGSQTAPSPEGKGERGSISRVGMGWSLKKLHRMILLSEAWQQLCAATPEQIGKDPENRWLGRFSPRRVDAEELRDSMLAVAGSIDLKQGGPACADMTIHRRSLYVQTARWDRGTFALLFDAANPDASVEKRDVSTVAPQALFLMNNDFVLTQAKRLADRLAREAPRGDSDRIQRAYQLLFARPASAEEIRICRSILNRSAKPTDAWRDLAHVLLCSNEFAYLD